MTLVREVGWLSRHDPNIGSIKDYLGNLEDVKYEISLLDLFKQVFW